MKLQIGFDAKRYYHNRTGLGNYSRTLVDSLKRHCPECETVLYDEGALTRTFSLGRKAEKDGCDIFHGLSNEIPRDLPSCRTKSVVTIHDVAWRTFPSMYSWVDRQLYEWKYGHSCRIADRVLAISESTKKDIVRFYGVDESRIRVIYQPVQECYYTPLDDTFCDKAIKDFFGPNGLPPFILYVGSLNSRKNLLGAIEALSMIPKDNRPLLVAVGNGGEYKKACEDFILRHALENDVRIETGINDNRLLQALYTKAMAFIYPSFYEGFGLPVVEAALQKTPVITTTVSSLPEAAGPDACLIDPHDENAVEHIKMHLENLVSDMDLAKDIGEKMEKYARKMFTPEVLTRQVNNLYFELMT